MKVNLPSTREAELSDDLIQKIKDKLKQMGNPEYYWDYRDNLSEEQINTILSKKDGIFDVENKIFENNFDYNYDLEVDHLKGCLEWFKSELAEELDEEDLDLKELAKELREELLDYLSVDINIKDLIKRAAPVNCRVELYSNYDCINSHWFEAVGGGGYGYEETYFGAMVDALNLNPAKLQKFLTQKDIRTHGKFPNKKSREGKEYVDYDKFITELKNSTCGANLLTIVCKVDLEMIIEKGMPKKFIIPKGNNVGLFSSFQGGGSIIECPLIRDMEIDTEKFGDTKYDHWSLVPDTKEHGYTMNDVYGVHSDFFCNEITIVPSK